MLRSQQGGHIWSRRPGWTGHGESPPATGFDGQLDMLSLLALILSRLRTLFSPECVARGSSFFLHYIMLQFFLTNNSATFAMWAEAWDNLVHIFRFYYKWRPTPCGPNHAFSTAANIIFYCWTISVLASIIYLSGTNHNNIKRVTSRGEMRTNLFALCCFVECCDASHGTRLRRLVRKWYPPRSARSFTSLYLGS